MLAVNTKAPDFTLQDKDGNSVSLSDFHGKKIILYFYPKDNTPGCTRQACAFAKAYDEFKKDNIVVIGISKDSVASHQKFAEKYSLPFVILSDPELLAIKAYDVWQEKKLYGKVSMGVVRTTYIINEQGIIEDAKFKTYGCGSAIASSSLLTEWVKGKTLEEAKQIKNTDIAAELELPPVKIHCSVLAEDAIRSAIEDYQRKQQEAQQ